MVDQFPDVNAVRVVCNHHDEHTTESDENDLQDDIDSQAIFRLLKSNISFCILRYKVEPQHDLENRMQQHIQDMLLIA